VCGGTIRNVPAGRFLIFITLWSLLVYNPVARWSWHWAGWSNQFGVMDFAGGTAVHITSGTAVLAFQIFYELDRKGFSTCWKRFWEILLQQLRAPFELLKEFREPKLVRPRRRRSDSNDSDELELENQLPTGGGQNGHTGDESHDDPEAQQPDGRLGLGSEADKPPHNVNNMVLGTALLWIGWFGFNGGSALGGNLRAVSATVSTHVAACAGGTTSLLFFWLWSAVARVSSKDRRRGHKVPSVTHFCDGAVIALVAITPAAGYVSLLALNL
jgi:ammonia channel protein AmtB